MQAPVVAGIPRARCFGSLASFSTVKEPPKKILKRRYASLSDVTRRVSSFQPSPTSAPSAGSKQAGNTAARIGELTRLGRRLPSPGGEGQDEGGRGLIPLTR